MLFSELGTAVPLVPLLLHIGSVCLSTSTLSFLLLKLFEKKDTSGTK